jgi:hypothetical protein
VDERAETEPLVTIVRAALGVRAFGEVWEQGRSMTPEQAARWAGTPAGVVSHHV